MTAARSRTLIDVLALPPSPGAIALPEDREYRPFPNEEGRNSRQAWLEIPVMVRALGLPQGGRVLEVGCGRGVALPVLHRLLHPTRLVGLDLDAASLREARTRRAGAGIDAELVPGDVRRLPFPDAAFDLVIDFGTCYHIARAEAGLAEISRVLAPGGLFVQETPLGQLLSHPVRSFGRRIPWRLVPLLERHRTAIIWSARRRVAGASQ
ncbi:MAG TPA: class I SAM-dependent methyltransferase [Gemmatimonadales bacterium]|nr:class I SAM-dependent methyltransferase [Gemmatimonadales bacterium]